MDIKSEHGAWLFVLGWDLHHPGGVTQVVRNLMRSIDRFCHRRTILLVKSWEHGSMTKIDGTYYARCRVPGRNLWQLLVYLWHLPLEIWRLRRLISEEGIRTMNLHYPSLDALTPLLTRIVCARYLTVVISFHGMDIQSAQESSRFEQLLWKLVLRLADAITVCDESLRQQLIQRFVCRPGCVHVIDNGVDVEELTNLEKLAPATNLPARFVLTLATFEHKKGLDILMRAFERIAADFADVELILAGRVGQMDFLDSLRELRSTLSSGSRIRFLLDLPHEEAMRVLARATVFVLPSRREPFGIAILEACALGVPAVASAACGVISRLQSPDEVVVVPPEDETSLGAALAEALSKAVQPSRRAQALRDRIDESFSWRKISSRYVALELN
jgi:glycosyltransferase involved in cell wall biosynthesis